MNGKAVAVETRAITPPTATISSPTSGTAYITSASSITLAGTASDNVGVTQVTWKNNRGGSGTCSGTTSWTCSGIALQSGQNVLTVVAHDAENSTGGDALTVTREEPCTYQLYPSPYEALYAPVEGSSNLEGYVTTGSGCTWEATSNDGWIQIAPASETGSGMFFINVDPNIFFYPRSGSITVAGNTYTIYQSGYY